MGYTHIVSSSKGRASWKVSCVSLAPSSSLWKAQSYQPSHGFQSYWFHQCRPISNIKYAHQQRLSAADRDNVHGGFLKEALLRYELPRTLLWSPSPLPASLRGCEFLLNKPDWAWDIMQSAKCIWGQSGRAWMRDCCSTQPLWPQVHLHFPFQAPIKPHY